MEENGVSLRKREGWCMMLLAQTACTIATALGEDSDFAEELNQLAPLWSAGARLRLGQAMRPHPVRASRPEASPPHTTV